MLFKTAALKKTKDYTFFEWLLLSPALIWCLVMIVVMSLFGFYMTRDWSKL